MRIARKLIYAAVLIGSAVFVSFRGSAILWLLFYFTLVIPLLSLLYTLYVYFCFRVGQRVAYKLEFANEDRLLMTGISLNFYADKVWTVKKRERRKSCCGLNPTLKKPRILILRNAAFLKDLFIIFFKDYIAFFRQYFPKILLMRFYGAIIMLTK